MTVWNEESKRVRLSPDSPDMWRAIGIAAAVIALGTVLVCILYPEALHRVLSLL